MSEPLKYMYNVQFFEQLCAVLKKVIPQFNERRFIYAVFDHNWPALELKQRTRQITHALHQCLPAEYPKAALLIAAISRELKNEKLEQHYPFIFLPDYIEVYGIEHFSISMNAMKNVHN